MNAARSFIKTEPEDSETEDRDDEDRRKWSRYDMETAVPVTVVVHDRPLDCFIENISLTGAKLRFPDLAPKGDEIQFDSNAVGLLDAQCVWTRGRHMGIDMGLCQRSVALTLRCICEFPPLTGTEPGKAAKAAAG